MCLYRLEHGGGLCPIRLVLAREQAQLLPNIGGGARQLPPVRPRRRTRIADREMRFEFERPLAGPCSESSEALVAVFGGLLIQCRVHFAQAAAQAVHPGNLGFVEAGEKNQRAGDKTGEGRADLDKPPVDRVVAALGAPAALQFVFVTDIAEHARAQGKEEQHAAGEQHGGNNHQVRPGRVIADYFRQLRGAHQADGENQGVALAQPGSDPVEGENRQQPGHGPHGAVDAEQRPGRGLVAGVEVKDGDVVVQQADKIKTHRQSKDNGDQAEKAAVAERALHIGPERRPGPGDGGRFRLPASGKPPEA